MASEILSASRLACLKVVEENMLSPLIKKSNGWSANSREGATIGAAPWEELVIEFKRYEIYRYPFRVATKDRSLRPFNI